MFYEALPDSVTVNGRAYGIYTDFRDWMKFMDMLEDENFTKKQRFRMIPAWFRELPPVQGKLEALEALIAFAFRIPADGAEQKAAAPHTTEKILSWSYDSPYIYAAFLSAYRMDLLQIEYLHWHAFLSLFDALPGDTPIKQRMYYRGVNVAEVSDSKEKQRILKIQSQIRIPGKRLDAYRTGDFFG